MTFRKKILFIIIPVVGLLVGCAKETQPTVTMTVEPGLERPSPPAPFTDLTNPLPFTEKNEMAGKDIFSKNCSTCHGENGEGDGPAAASLDPKPQKLDEVNKNLSDAYLFWRISEGGTMDPFKSAMPPWKAILNEDQIWQTIIFIRSLE